MTTYFRPAIIDSLCLHEIIDIGTIWYDVADLAGVISITPESDITEEIDDAKSS